MSELEQQTPSNYSVVPAMPGRLGYSLYSSSLNVPTLAITHGWAADSEFTKPLVNLFSSFRVMLIDLPGYGLSSSLWEDANDFNAIAKLIVKTVPPGAILMSWSLSTLYAIKSCSIPSFNPQALITVCGSPRFPDEKNNPGFDQKYIHKLSSSFNANNAQKLIKLFYTIQGVGTVGSAIKECFSRFTIPSYEVLQNGIQHMISGDERQDLLKLHIPKFHLFGKNDLLVPATQASLLKDMANTRCHIFGNSAHLPFITEPQSFKEQVLTFLRSIPDFRTKRL